MDNITAVQVFGYVPIVAFFTIDPLALLWPAEALVVAWTVAVVAYSLLRPKSRFQVLSKSS